MFNRDVITYLYEWKERTNRKPLIIRGARQVGKTTVVQMFAKSFAQSIYLNLENTQDRRIFETDISFVQKVEGLFFLRGLNPANGPTLLFIDEIQHSPEAILSLRYFHENRPDLFVIATGSLLENISKGNISFPVGRVEYLTMHPCSFCEFLAAIGEESSLKIVQQVEIPGYAHEPLLKLFNRFALIGGMPGIIEQYSRNKNLAELGVLYEGLIASYMDDIEKYARNHTMEQVLRHLIRNVFQQCSTRITFEGFGQSRYKSREVGEAFRLLEKVMLIQLIYPVESTLLPMLPNMRKSPRLFILDVGLVNYFAKVDMEVFEKQDITDAFRGRIAEQVIGQELFSGETSVLSKLFFWTREERTSQAEVDYVFLYQGTIIPIEVKSGSKGRLRSLHQFIEQCPRKLAVRFWSKPLLVEKAYTTNKMAFTLVNIPYYQAWNLQRILNGVSGN